MNCFDCIESILSKFVHSYQKVRNESPFLTQRFEDDGCLETIGNFFLTPAHYLLAGRTVVYVQETGRYEEKQTYDYHNCFWLKTVIAILALPISLILGSIFKGISYLLTDISTRRQAYAHQGIENHQKQYTEMGLKFSDEVGVSLNISKPTVEELTRIDPELAKRQKEQKQAFRLIAEIFEKHKLPYWIDCGTALGAHRHGDMIPWDTDVDISILQIDHQNAWKILKQELDSEKYEVLDWSSFDLPNTYIRVYIKEIDASIDLYHYEVDLDKHSAHYVYSFENSSCVPGRMKDRERATAKPLSLDTLFPLKVMNFDGIQARAANDMVTFLKSKYGEDLSPCRIWDSKTQQYEKVPDHPYWKQSDF